MNKTNWLKYSAFLLAFIILFLPSNTKAWIYLAVIAGILVFIWIILIYGFSDFLLYSSLVFLVLILISQNGSTEQKWFIWLGSISAFVLILKLLISKLK